MPLLNLEVGWGVSQKMEVLSLNCVPSSYEHLSQAMGITAFQPIVVSYPQYMCEDVLLVAVIYV